MVACISVQEKDGGGLEQDENRGGDGVMLDSAYILMVEPTGLVKGHKIFSVRGQIVTVAIPSLLQLLSSVQA